MTKGLRRRQERRRAAALEKKAPPPDPSEKAAAVPAPVAPAGAHRILQRASKDAPSAAAANSDELPPQSAVLRITHLHHQFGERQLRQFCTEFGDVKKLRVIRSIRSGNSTGRAYVEFAFREVAEIVAKALNGYYLGGLIIRASLADSVPATLFKPRRTPTRALYQARLRAAAEKAAARPAEVKLRARQRKQRKLFARLEALGLKGIYDEEEKQAKDEGAGEQENAL